MKGNPPLNENHVLAGVSTGLSDVRDKLVNLGRHLLVEFYECNSNILNNVEYIEQMMVGAAVECGATVIEKNFHMFSPFGVSGVVIIAESHLAIHTFPELGFAALNVYSCRVRPPPELAELLRGHLGARGVHVREVARGSAQ